MDDVLEMVERVARAMKDRAAQPYGNIPTLEPVLVGCLGDMWRLLAATAIEAMREPTVAMSVVGGIEAKNSIPNNGPHVGTMGTLEFRNGWRCAIDCALGKVPA